MSGFKVQGGVCTLVARSTALGISKTVQLFGILISGPGGCEKVDIGLPGKES